MCHGLSVPCPVLGINKAGRQASVHERPRLPNFSVTQGENCGRASWTKTSVLPPIGGGTVLIEPPITCTLRYAFLPWPCRICSPCRRADELQYRLGGRAGDWTVHDAGNTVRQTSNSRHGHHAGQNDPFSLPRQESIQRDDDFIGVVGYAGISTPTTIAAGQF